MRKKIFWAIVVFNIIAWTVMSITSSNKTNKSKSIKIQLHQENTNTVKTTIGGKEIFIPFPDGWYEISKDKPELVEIFKKMTYSPFRLVAAFLPNKNKGIPDLNRYILITVSTDVERMPDMLSSDFSWYRSQIKEQQYTLAANFRSKYGDGDLNNIKNSPIKFKIGEMTPLGVFINKSSAIAVATLMSTETIIDQDMTYNNVIVGAATLRVKGKMFNIQVLSKYKTGVDIIWMKAKTNELVDLILKEN
jgi:hypothetical protein